MKKVLIYNAITWALVILVTSFIFKDHENYEYLLGILVIGFTLQNSLTFSILKNKKPKF
ncbi:hypothetical protein [Christiangramia salexigens]|uniref:hypothetical protein n=1 Tax=Christiangramia salexigens TaxID=1913577 RepID=UPI0012EC2BA2|nr:hypothetical protein [Christiangramia salexigens]